MYNKSYTYWKDIADWSLCFKMSDILRSSQDSAVKRDKGNTYWARFLTSRSHSLRAFIIISIFSRYISSRSFISLFHTLCSLPQSHISNSFDFLFLRIFDSAEKSRRKTIIENIALKNWILPQKQGLFSIQKFDRKIIVSSFAT